MKGVIRNSMLALALLTNTAIAQDVPCVDPCGGDGGGEGGGCTNTDVGTTSRYSHTTFFPPNIVTTCNEIGRQITVTCTDANGNVSRVTVTYWTGQYRCWSSM
jgi:hypothetical protein